MLKHIYEPAESVDQSRWSTRGWTFQEGCMSRRKLFFTGEGVALWCTSMYYEEGVSRKLSDIDEVREYLVPSSLRLVAPRPSSADRLDEVIREYTMRTVTYEDDTLNACLGVLNHLGYKHLWGVVIREQPFSLELCWVRRTRTYNAGPEQEAFPSWSWTRWRGAVEVFPQNYPSSITSVKTRLPSGEEFDILRDTRYTGNLGAICSGKMLRITGTFLTPRFLVTKQQEGVVCRIILSCACGADIEMSTSLDIGRGIIGSSITSMTAYLDDTEILEVMPLYQDGLLHGQFLLVKKHMDAYRRIGVNSRYGMYHTCAKLGEHGTGIVPVEGRRIRTIDLIQFMQHTPVPEREGASRLQYEEGSPQETFPGSPS